MTELGYVKFVAVSWICCWKLNVWLKFVTGILNFLLIWNGHLNLLVAERICYWLNLKALWFCCWKSNMLLKFVIRTLNWLLFQNDYLNLFIVERICHGLNLNAIWFCCWRLNFCWKLNVLLKFVVGTLNLLVFWNEMIT